ncbi:MAG: GIY-YIG nuclease family protein [Ruminococcus sp.]
MGGIYAIQNIVNNKYYVGQTKDFDQRWRQHSSRLLANKHENYHLQNAWNKYGADNFVFSIIEECASEIRDEREMFWIKEKDSFDNGYNLDQGGGGCLGYKHSQDEINKMRQAHHPDKVVQLDMELNYIRTWDSAAQAGKELGLSGSGIRACIRHKNYQKTIGGYFWILEAEYNSDTLNMEWFNIRNHKPRKIIQFDQNMNFIQTFPSIASAQKQLHLKDISSVCTRRRKTTHGFIFRYFDGYDEQQYLKDKEDISKPKNFNYSNLKPILQFSLDSQLIKEYKNSIELEQTTSFNKKLILRCCQGYCKTSGGYIWKYKDA